MQYKLRHATSFVMLAAALLLSGCATEPASEPGPQLPPAPPPAADLGPEFEVSRIATHPYAVNGVMDSAGRAHLIIAQVDTQVTLQEKKDIRHLIIAWDGTVSAEPVTTVVKPVIRHGVNPGSVDIAFDRAGNLHALVDDEHLVLKEGKWVGSQRTPWKEANIRFGENNFESVRWLTPPAFVKGMPELTWAFDVVGGDIGLSRRFEFGVTFYAVVPLPVPELNLVWKTVVVPEETPYRHWYALGMENNSDVVRTYNYFKPDKVIGDKRGTIHAFYENDHPPEERYAEFRAGGECAKPDRARAIRAEGWYERILALQLKNGTPVCPILGAPLSVEGPAATQELVQRIRRGSLDDPRVRAVAADPESGAVLVIVDGARASMASILVGTGAGEAPSEMPVQYPTPAVAPAGKNRFHALGIRPHVSYLEYSGGAWSGPVAIGEGNDPVIVSDGKGRALLLWSKRDGPVDVLVARWVTLK